MHQTKYTLMIEVCIQLQNNAAAGIVLASFPNHVE